MSDGLFWGLMCAVMAAALGAGIAFAVGEISNAGWVAGGALGVLVFVIATFLFARSATSANLPPPNTLKAPVAPKGGAFQAPKGGAFRAPGAPIKRETAASAFTPAPAASLADMGQMGKSAGETVDKAAHDASEMAKAAGEAVSKAAYSVSAAVTGAAQAARDALSGVVGSGDHAPGAPAAPAAPATPVEPGNAVKPATLDAPRAGGPDDLKRIRGVGPKLEELLHSLGFYHFDQIAAWGPSELAWVDSNLEGFNGRATRDDWVGQSKILAAGGETEHSQRVDRGEST